MHAHIPPPQAGTEEVETTLFLYLAAGVTTVRGMLGDPSHLEYALRSIRGVEGVYDAYRVVPQGAQ